MPLRNWIGSLNYAIEGILIAAKSEKHFRYHIFSAITVVLFSYIAGITKMEFLIISIAAMSVIVTELINTAIETVIDLVSPEISEKARIAKDTAAGAVLMTAACAVLIGYVILFPYMRYFFQGGVYLVKHAGDEVAVLAVLIVFVLVILGKALTGKGHPLRGGMPSGHTALSFSFWVTITMLTENLMASALAFIMAIFIAQSRVMTKIHSRLEVAFGAMLGTVITYLVFKIFT